MSNIWMTNALLAAGKENEAEIGFSIPSPAKLVRKAGRAVAGTLRTARRVHNKISDTLASVPVVGPGLDAVYTLNPLATPVTIAASVASGDRIDKAVYAGFKEKVKAYQDIAPYVQTVVSTVPGIGQGISGAIGAANALSKGRPITEAMIEAGRGALPGGPVAAAAFDVAVAAAQGKPVPEVMLNGIPIPPEQKKLVVAGVMTGIDIANGKKVDQAVYNRGVSLLPPQAQQAVSIGIALAQGQKLQKIAQNEIPRAAGTFIKLGSERIAKCDVLKSGANLLKGAGDGVEKGFATGLGFMQHKITPSAMLALRGSLTGNEKKGFDIAVSTHIGEVARPVGKDVSAKMRFGYYATQGMQGNKPGRKTDMMRTLTKDPEIRKGAGKAVNEILGTGKRSEDGFWGFWKRFIRALTT